MVGKKDGATSRDMLMANAHNIARAVDIPVSDDLSNGFGEAAEAVGSLLALGTLAF